jgi:hypothetical protein
MSTREVNPIRRLIPAGKSPSGDNLYRVEGLVVHEGGAFSLEDARQVAVVNALLAAIGEHSDAARAWTDRVIIDFKHREAT